MKYFLVLLYLVVFTTVTNGGNQKLAELKTAKKTYENVTVLSINDDGVQILYQDGGGTIPWTDLNDDQKQTLGYYNLMKKEEAQREKDAIDAWQPAAEPEPQTPKNIWKSRRLTGWTELSSGLATINNGETFIMKARVTKIDDAGISDLAIELTDEHGESLKKSPLAFRNFSGAGLLDLFNNGNYADFAIEDIDESGVQEYRIVDIRLISQ